MRKACRLRPSGRGHSTYFGHDRAGRQSFTISQSPSRRSIYGASVAAREAGVRPVAHGVSRGRQAAVYSQPQRGERGVSSFARSTGFRSPVPANPQLTLWAKLLRPCGTCLRRRGLSSWKLFQVPWHGHPARDRTRPGWPCHEVRRRHSTRERGHVDFFRRPAWGPSSQPAAWQADTTPAKDEQKLSTKNLFSRFLFFALHLGNVDNL